MFLIVRRARGNGERQRYGYQHEHSIFHQALLTAGGGIESSLSELLSSSSLNLRPPF
jgi:hypothetical protein